MAKKKAPVFRRPSARRAPEHRERTVPDSPYSRKELAGPGSRRGFREQYPERPRGASYTKGRQGDWLIRLHDLPPVAPGSVVRVRLKSGEYKDETLGRRLWSSEDDRTHLYAIWKEQRPRGEEYARENDDLPPTY